MTALELQYDIVCRNIRAVTIIHTIGGGDDASKTSDFAVSASHFLDRLNETAVLYCTFGPESSQRPACAK